MDRWLKLNVCKSKGIYYQFEKRDGFFYKTKEDDIRISIVVRPASLQLIMIEVRNVLESYYSRS